MPRPESSGYFNNNAEDLMNKPISLLSKEHNKDPFATYDFLRSSSPVAKLKLDEEDIWAVSKFSDAKFILNNSTIFSSSGYQPMFANSWISEDLRGARYIASMDGRQHKEHRTILHNALKRALQNDLVKIMETTAHSLVVNTKPGTPIDFNKHYTLPYISTIVAHIIGTDINQPISEIQEWVELEDEHKPADPSPTFIERFERIMRRQHRIFDEVIENRRCNPQNDLVTELVQATIDDEPLSDAQLRDALSLVGAAGYQTAIHALNSSMLELSQRKSLLNLLRDNHKLIPKFIDELLRLQPPLHNALRITTQEVTLGNELIPENSLVLILIASANRDPEVFDRANEFDINRSRSQNLSFGDGPHKCVGEAIAKKELAISLKALLSNFSDITLLDNSNLEYTESVFVRGVKALPLIFSK